MDYWTRLCCAMSVLIGMEASQLAKKCIRGLVSSWQENLVCKRAYSGTILYSVRTLKIDSVNLMWLYIRRWVRTGC